MRTRLIVIGVVAAVFCGGVLSAQEATKSKAATSPAKKTEEVAVRYDYSESVWGQKNTVLLKGNVKITHGDTVLVCDEVLYDQDTQVATSPGKVTITDPECDITGDKGTAYLKKRIAVIEGSVNMLVKPKKTEEAKPDAKEGSAESVRAKVTRPTTVTCAKLEYNYRGKIASATGDVALQQEKRNAKAKKLVYDEKKEFLTLIGDVSGVDEKGQTLSTPDKVEIWTKKGAERVKVYSGASTFQVEVDEE